MVKEDYPEFLRMINKLANSYRIEINSDLIDSYWESLQGYSRLTVSYAFKEASEKLKWFPSKQELLTYCGIIYQHPPALVLQERKLLAAKEQAKLIENKKNEI